MSILNDLTDEDRAAFEAHGIELPAADGPLTPAATEQPVAATEQPAASEAVTQPAEPAPTASDATQQPASTKQPAPAAASTEQEQRMVPLAALHQERQRYAQLAQQHQALVARANSMLAQQQPPTLELPALDQDPQGFVQGLGDTLQAFQQEQFETQRDNQISSAIEQDEQMARAYMPDYDQAMGHYVDSRVAELSVFNTPQQVQAILHNEVRQIAQQSWNQGRSFAQSVYALAKARGYAVPQAQPAIGMQPAPALAAPQPAAAPAPAAAVASIRQAQAMGKSLSAAPATAATKTLNAEALLSLNDEDFAKAFGLGSRSADAKFQALFGGN